MKTTITNNQVFVDGSLLGDYQFNAHRGCSCRDTYTITTHKDSHTFKGRYPTNRHIEVIMNKEVSQESKDFAEKILRECVDCEKELVNK